MAMTMRCRRPIVFWSEVKAAIRDHHVVITQTFTLVNPILFAYVCCLTLHILGCSANAVTTGQVGLI